MLLQGNAADINYTPLLFCWNIKLSFLFVLQLQYSIFYTVAWVSISLQQASNTLVFNLCAKSTREPINRWAQ